jgi:hypothetical protein
MAAPACGFLTKIDDVIELPFARESDQYILSVFLLQFTLKYTLVSWHHVLLI